MTDKSKKMRADGKALLIACKAILATAPNGVPTEEQDKDIAAKRKEASDLIHAADTEDAVESALHDLDAPVVRKPVISGFSSEESAIEPNSDVAIDRVHAFGGRFIKKADAYKMGCYIAYLGAKASKIRCNEARWLQKCRDIFEVNAAQIEGSDLSGGNLVFPEFDTNIINLREVFGTFRRNVAVKTMNTDIKKIIRRVSGLQMYLVGEAQKIVTSQKKWDLVQLVAKKCGAIAVSSVELSEDSAVDLGADIMSELAYCAGLGEDNAGWNGDGTSGGTIEYLGMTGVRTKLKNLSSTISKIYGLTVGSGSGHTTDYTGLTLIDFQNVIGNLPAYADTPNCKWYVHRTFYHTVMVKLAQAAGGTQMPQILAGDGVRRFFFMGYPVEFVQSFPKSAAASQVCALFGDLTLAAKMGDRKSLEFAVSQDATVVDGSTTINLWQNDCIAWRMIERIDINVHDVGTNSDLVATPTIDIPGAGPIVGLITAAS